MKILLLFIIIYDGGTKYRVDEFDTMTRCEAFREEVLAELKTYPKPVRIVRSECFQVGQEI